MTPGGIVGETRRVSLLERLEAVLDEREWSAAEWSRRAGLKEPTHLSTFMGRLRKDPEATIDLLTAARLAAAADVSLDWLALGRGSQSGGFVKVEPDPVYPSRAAAIAGAIIVGYRPEAIARVKQVSHFAADPGVEAWLALLRAENDGAIKMLPSARAVPKKHVSARKRRKH